MAGRLTRPDASKTAPVTAAAVRGGVDGAAVVAPEEAESCDQAAACAAQPPGPLKSVLLAASDAAAFVASEGFLTQASAAWVAADSCGFNLSATFRELWEAHHTPSRSDMPWARALVASRDCLFFSNV